MRQWFYLIYWCLSCVMFVCAFQLHFFNKKYPSSLLNTTSQLMYVFDITPHMHHPICEPTTPLLPHFFGQIPYTAFRGPYVLKGPCCFSCSMNWSFSEWPFTWIPNVSHFCLTLMFINQEGRNQTTNLKKFITKKIWSSKHEDGKRYKSREWSSHMNEDPKTFSSRQLG